MRAIPSLVPVLLLVACLPTVQPDGHGDWHIDDQVGDVTSDPNLPLAPPSVLDLRKIVIEQEDEMELVLLLELADLPLTDNSGSTQSVTYRIRFELAGSEAAYELTLRAYALVAETDPSDWSLMGSFCSSYLDVNDVVGSGGTVPCDFVPDKKGIRYHIPKATLHNDAHSDATRRAFDLGERVDFTIGAILTNFEATAEAEHTIVSLAVEIQYEDRVPEAGPSDKTYKMRYASANTALKIRSGRGSHVYAPGYNQTYQFSLENAQGPKRLVKLEYSFWKPQDAADGFQVHGPAVVSVPSNSVRNFTFSFKSPEGPHDPVYIRIKGTSVGTNDVGVTQVTMENGTFLGPETRTLYLLQQEIQRGPTDCLVNTCWGSGLRLSEKTSLAGYTTGTTGFIPFWPLGFYTPSLGYEALVGTSAPPEVNVKIGSRYADIEGVTVTVSLEAGRGSGARIMEMSKEGIIKKGGDMWSFKGPVKSKPLQIPAGSSVRLAVEVSQEPGAHAFVTQTNGVELYLDGSSVFIPFEPVPDLFVKNQLPSPFQITVQGDRDEFVNQGEARLFNVTVLNFDSVEQRVTLDATADKPWPLEILPSNQFDLPPGQTITVGVLVRAPADAPEGETASILVNATSDNGAKVGVRLNAIASQGVELSDDSGRYQADPDDLALQVQPAKKSPAVHPILALLALAGLAGLRRRFK